MGGCDLEDKGNVGAFPRWTVDAVGDECALWLCLRSTFGHEKWFGWTAKQGGCIHSILFTTFMDIELQLPPDWDTRISPNKEVSGLRIYGGGRDGGGIGQ